MRDELYKSTKKILNNFNFNEDTANVFNDMLKRSVPHYYEIQNMICDITKHFLQKNSNIYDYPRTIDLINEIKMGFDLARQEAKNNICFWPIAKKELDEDLDDLCK